VRSMLQSRHPIRGDVAAYYLLTQISVCVFFILDETGTQQGVSMPAEPKQFTWHNAAICLPPHPGRIISLSMPSFMDSGVLILLVLILFGPKQLPVLARQFGKLMNDFRRASNEFRTQMEDELRVSEQAERQKKISAESAATPAVESTPALEADTADYTSHLPNDPMNDPPSEYLGDTGDSPYQSSYGSVTEEAANSVSEASPTLPIATAGELSILPPATGLPTPNSSPGSHSDHSVPAQSTPTETEALHS